MSDVRPDAAQPTPGPPRAATLLALAVVAAVPLFLVAYYRHVAGPGYPLDDAWIHLSFARNLAAGEGFGINPGQPSTGATSPLWALLLTLGFAGGADHTLWPWVLGLLGMIAGGCAAMFAVRHILARRAGGLAGSDHALTVGAGLLVGSTGPLIWSAAGAMETPLLVALLLWAYGCHARAPRLPRPPRGRTLPWGIPAGLACLARPEGILFALLLAACSRPRAMVRNLLLVFLCCAPYAVYCAITSGRPLSSTFYAKTSSAVSGLPDLGYLLGSGRLLGELDPPLTVLLLLGCVLLAGTVLRQLTASSGAGDRAWWRGWGPGALFLIALPAAYAVMGRTFLFAGLAGNFGRYFYPLLPIMAVVGIGALGQAVPRGAERRFTAGIRGALLVVVAGLVVWNAALAARGAAPYAHHVRDINRMQVEMARRLQSHLPVGALVAANDVGALAYFTELRVLDLVGIVSPEVGETLFPLRGADRPTRHTALMNLIIELQPAAIVVFPRWYPEILQALEPLREPLEVIRVPDNVTSAGAVLEAYRLHWQRLSPD